jgi:VWFA-related protein
MLPRSVLAAFITASILCTVTAQQPQSTPSPIANAQKSEPPAVDAQDVVRITTNLVQVDVSVTKDGKPVTDLQPEDFEIFEDGKPQTITNFSYVSNVPGNAPLAASPVAKSKDKTAPPIPPANINLNDQRRTIALVVDDLGMSFESMSRLRPQIKKFLDTLLPNDLIAIIRTGGDVGALQQFTNDRRVLQSAIDRLRWNPCSRAGFNVFQPAGPKGDDDFSIPEASNTGVCSEVMVFSSFKALRYILQGMSHLPGRKSMMFFSDYLPVQDQEPSASEQTKRMAGDTANTPITSVNTNARVLDDSYQAQLERIAEMAIRSSVVIYSVDTRGLQYTGTTAEDRSNLHSRTLRSNPGAAAAEQKMRERSQQLWIGQQGSNLIARQSGGFLVRNTNDFGFNRVMDDQQGYYLIGFRPTEETFNRDFHRLKAKVKRGGVSVRTRDGFFGFTETETRPPEPEAKSEMTKALISPFGSHDLAVQLTSFFIEEADKAPALRSFIFLDAHNLAFTDLPDGSHATNLSISTILFGDNGKVVGQEDQTGTLRFDKAGYERAMRDGIAYSFDTSVKLPGTFQFRVAVREAGSGRIGTASQFIQVPDLKSGRLALSGIVVRDADRGASLNIGSQDDEVTTGPAVRRFHQGSTAAYGYLIYNANAAGRAAQLTSQTRIFRDGRMIVSNNPAVINMQGQTDPQRIRALHHLELGKEMAPGNYVLQIIVTDLSDKKPRVASRWIDFEVAP